MSMKDIMQDELTCRHYDREEIDQSIWIKRIRCKDCGWYKCIQCDNFFPDLQVKGNLWLNFCSSKCMFDNMKEQEKTFEKEGSLKS